jgi:hypothetical protein
LFVKIHKGSGTLEKAASMATTPALAPPNFTTGALMK